MNLVDPTRLGATLAASDPFVVSGRVSRASPALLEVLLPKVAVGTTCEVRLAGGRTVLGEVVGFTGNVALLMPLGEMSGVSEGDAVVPLSRAAEISVGDALLGRVVDPQMNPVDGGPPMSLPSRARLQAAPPAAMARRRIAQPLPMGIRALDTLLTIGEGQRMGIFAGPGVGKSVLMGMLARSAAVDVIVVGLVGERGREVREFVERDLGPEGLARSVVVVATADESPVFRIRAALSATAVAEHFRARGQRVLLLVDSLTRVAMAQREVGLAAREPPTSKGYPPSVFAVLPRLLERAGNDDGPGSITALYTVLAEGDDLSDPVADASRAALDGHIVLSRKLAGAGHFPAIDVLGSVSRCMPDVTPPDHRELARLAREVLATYRDSQDLVEVGAYAAGSNPKLDRALAMLDPLNAFLRQEPEQRVALPDALAELKKVVTARTGGARG